MHVLFFCRAASPNTAWSGPHNAVQNRGGPYHRGQDRGGYHNVGHDHVGQFNQGQGRGGAINRNYGGQSNNQYNHGNQNFPPMENPHQPNVQHNNFGDNRGRGRGGGNANSPRRPKQDKPPRTKQQTEELTDQLKGIFPEEAAKIQEILQNHPGETDMTKLTNYLMNAMF